jgi:hypothetical protein
MPESLEYAGITYVQGNAAFADSGGSSSSEDNSITSVQASKILVASGSTPFRPGGNHLTGRECLTVILITPCLIYPEIVERRQYQMDLEEVEAGDATRDQIADQIRVRVERLKKIDPMRATMVVKQMIKSS